MFKKRLIPALLFSALAAASASSHAVTFSGVYLFGDSLSDAGYFRPILPALGVPAAAVPIVGRFTTGPGPVWSELVSQHYGAPGTPSNVSGGNIFAQGGARVTLPSTADLTAPGGDVNRSVSTQINEYFAASGGMADRNALYGVWAGANDFFVQFFAYGAGTITQAQLQTNTLAATTAEIQQIGRLSSAGARYILVFGLPDIGTSLTFTALGATAAGGATALSAGYNTTLFTGLQSSGLRVIPVDTFTLFSEIRANYAAYGITNSTAPACLPVGSSSLTCGPTSLAAANAASTYAFADGVHPTTAVHRIIADFVESLIDGPQQMSLLAEAPLRTREGHIRTLDAGLQSAMYMPTGKLTAFAAADGAKFDINAGDTNLNTDTKNRSVTVGLTMRASDTFTLGVGVGKSTSDATFANGKGGFETDESVLSFFGAIKMDGFYANGSVSVADVSYDNIRRNIPIGIVTRTASSSTSGSNTSGNLTVGYDFGISKVSVGPFVSFTSQNVDVNAFTESGSGSADLKISSQKRISRILSAGIRASADMGRFTPFARISLDKEQKNDEREILANPVSVTAGNTYGIPGYRGDSSWGTATIGVRANLSERFGVSLIYSSVFSRGDVKQDALTASATYRF